MVARKIGLIGDALAAETGADPQALLRRAGITPKDLRDPELRMYRSTEAALWDVLANRFDPGLPARLGRSFDLDSYGTLISEMAALAPDSGGMIAVTSKSLPVFGTGVEYQLVHALRSFRIVIRFAGAIPLAPRLAFAASGFSQWLNLVARFSQRDRVIPQKVLFQAPEPPGAQDLRDAFGCPVVFGAEVDALVLDRELIKIKNNKSDPERLAALESEAQGQLLEGHRHTYLAVCAALYEEIGIYQSEAAADRDERREESFSMAHIAKDIGLSNWRKLQRLLYDEGTTFQEAKREVFSLHYMAYLEELGTKIEAGRMLGYQGAVSIYHRLNWWARKKKSDFHLH